MKGFFYSIPIGGACDLVNEDEDEQGVATDNDILGT